MLRTIHAHNLGALGDVEVEFAERLTLLTGDNGLGKTLLLDLAWFAATGGNTARSTLAPQRTGNGAATVRYVVDLGDATSTTEERFDARAWRWERDTTPFSDSLVIYAHADGAFDVWDFFRHARHVPYTHPDVRRVEGRFALSADAVWNGLEDDGRVLCNGLLRDWSTWQFQKPEVFARFDRAIGQLSAGLDETLRPGSPRRVSPDDARDVPTLRLPYGEVPVTLCSAGMRRVLALAYVLVWSLHERREAASLAGVDAPTDVVLLLDEVEAHLHPRWQRLLLPALLAVLDELAPSSARVQVIATTHAPLVLASLETRFDPSRDRALHLRRDGAAVSLRELPWSPQGDAVSWLVEHQHAAPLEPLVQPTELPRVARLGQRPLEVRRPEEERVVPMAEGRSRADVRDVIVTHVHLDHAGGVRPVGPTATSRRPRGRATRAGRCVARPPRAATA